MEQKLRLEHLKVFNWCITNSTDKLFRRHARRQDNREVNKKASHMFSINLHIVLWNDYQSHVQKNVIFQHVSTRKFRLLDDGKTPMWSQDGNAILCPSTLWSGESHLRNHLLSNKYQISQQYGMIYSHPPPPLLKQCNHLLSSKIPDITIIRYALYPSPLSSNPQKVIYLPVAPQKLHKNSR